LFSERNHICSVCVTNGHCDLQNLALKLGVLRVRYAYRHPSLFVDASHPRFVVDHNRCVLCARCVRVCDEIEGAHVWDLMGRGIHNRVIIDLDEPWGGSQTCTGCGKCVQVCPTGATYKTPDGPVLIDTKYCIGCQYCVQACPYGARSLNLERGTAEKCNWCYHRITKGLNPACVEVCPTGTRIFGDRMNPESPISLFLRNNRVNVLKPDMGNMPNVFYAGIDKEVL
jgi:Fe-S-cluster-containing dehydrogenase component